MTTPVDNADATKTHEGAARLGAQVVPRRDGLNPPPTAKRKKSPGGQRNTLKTLDSDKEIKGNPRVFL
jgi:hypothetical protein